MFPNYNKTAAIHRLQESSGKRSYADTGDTARLFLQPAAQEDALLYEGDVSKSFKAYTEYSGLIQTDRLIIDSVTYEVRSVQNYDFGTRKHYKLFLEQPK